MNESEEELKRPWIYFDLEGTGPDAEFDRIVEMCFYRGDDLALQARVFPECHIPASATAVHGITNEDVAQELPFTAYAEQVQELVTGAVLVGYNIRRYDSLLLHRELRMAGQPGLEVGARQEIVHPEVDLYRLWMNAEPRDLTTAVRRFTGRDLDAHTAEGDTKVLPHVLRGMLHSFNLAPSPEELVELSKPKDAVDREGKFRLQDGVVVFGFSKHKGEPVHHHPGMLRWMLERDFPPEAQALAMEYLDEIEAAQFGTNPY